MENLQELFEDQIKDLYSAENQLLKALPKMAKRAANKELKKGIEEHRAQTEAQLERLTQIAERRGFKPTGKRCRAMEGLIEEGAEVLEEDGEETVIDLAIVAAAQKVEHYEISAYGTARTLAEWLEDAESARLLQETLNEEKNTDVKLTKLAEKSLLPNCPANEEDQDELESSSEDEEDEDDDSEEEREAPRSR